MHEQAVQNMRHYCIGCVRIQKNWFTL